MVSPKSRYVKTSAEARTRSQSKQVAVPMSASHFGLQVFVTASLTRKDCTIPYARLGSSPNPEPQVVRRRGEPCLRLWGELPR